jgi:4-hydroxybenzoate polyprenyltransferase
MNQILEKTTNVGQRLYSTTVRLLAGRIGGDGEGDDSRFEENVKRNRISRRFHFAAVITAVAIAYLLSPEVSSTTQKDVVARFLQDSVIYNIKSKAFVAILPHLMFSALFFLIWHTSYNSFARRVEHRWINRALGPKGLATLSTSSMILAFITLALAPVSELGNRISLFYGLSIFSMITAFVFSLAYQGILSIAKDSSISRRPRRGELPEFFTLDTTSFGWVATNLLTAVCLGLMLIFIVYHGDFHNGWRISEIDGSVIAGPYYSRTLGFEAIYLFTLTVIGFFSGTFRTPLSYEKPNLVDEIADLNIRLSGAGGGTAPGGSTQGVEAPKGPVTDGAVQAIHAVLEMARFHQSVFAAGLLYAVSWNLSYSITFFLLLIFSYLVNDALDFIFGKDLLSHPHRPLPSGRAGVPLATVCIVLSALALFVSVLHLPDGSHRILFVGGVMVSLLYSLFLKRLFPLVATPLWSAMTVVIFLESVSASVGMYFVAISYFLGRELLLDVRDDHADRVFLVRPGLAQILGVHAATVALCAMIGALMIIPLVVSSNAALFAVVCTVFAVLLLALSCRPSMLITVSKFGYGFVLAVHFA